MEHVNCILCGANDPIELCRVRNDRYLKGLGITPPVSVKVVCRRCGHVYANPQLDPHELIRLYRDTYRSPKLDQRVEHPSYTEGEPSEEYLYWKRLKADRDYKWLKAHVPDGARPRTVLEIGCAEGLLLSMLAKDGWSARGVEPTATYAAHARAVHGIEVVEEPFEQARLEGPFDLVVALAVLEHAKDPLAFLRKIGALLGPEGIVYLTTPNVLDLGEFPDEMLSSPHLHLFTPATLPRALALCGFSPLQIQVGPGFTILGRPTSTSSPSELAVPTPPPRVPMRAILKSRVRARVRDNALKGRRAAKRAVAAIVGPRIAGRLIARLRGAKAKTSRPVGEAM